MEQHPIPQNVTQYQFRLIGDMTLKQFAILGGCLLVAFLIARAPLLPAILRWPLVGLLGGGGLAIAFLPMEERTLDVWLINFIKAIYSPTQYIWQKQAVLPAYFSYRRPPQPQQHKRPAQDMGRQQLGAYIQSLKQVSRDDFDSQEDKALRRIANMFESPTQTSDQAQTSSSYQESAPAATPPNRPTPLQTQPIPPTQTQTNANTNTETKIPAAGLVINVSANPNNPQQQPPQPTPTQPLSSESRNQGIKKQPPIPQTTAPQATSQDIRTPQSSPPPAGPIIGAAPPLTPPVKIGSLYPEPQRKTRVTTPQFLSDVQMPITPDTPNTLVGMTLTQDERLIPNVILEIKDNNGLPVRAVKSNQLSQFFISTPLKNGTYTVSAEHPEYKFDTIKIEAKGEVIPPIKVIALETFKG